MKPVVEIADLQRLARRRLPKLFYDYIDAGSWSESTYRANSEDLRRIRLRQRVARDISARSLETRLLGQPVALPLALAPTGLTGMFRADGEILAARAAEARGIPYTLSTMSICSIEDVAAATRKPFWFQLYVMRDRGFIERLIGRARDAGCSALVLTLDLQILGQRHNDLRNRLSAPPRLIPQHVWQVLQRPGWLLDQLRTRRHAFGNVVGHVEGVSDMASLFAWSNEQLDPTLDWKDVAWVRDLWDGPLLLKGILDAEDARLAADSGADGLIVSNHGGRQLDGAPSTIEVLPQIVDAVGDRLEVHLDGGIRSGQDILRALCLGARGVHIGRPFLYGLAALGQPGVELAIDLLARELDLTMAFCGERDVQALGPHNLYRPAAG